MKLALMETGMYLQIPVVWYLFRKFAAKDVSGCMIAGVMIGAFNEFATASLWDYHLRINIYQDIPLAILLCWAVMFTLVTYVSGRFYCLIFKKEKVDPQDKRTLLCDLLSALVISFPIETIGVKTGVWTYRMDRLDWDMGNVPFLNMPWEAVAGYCLFMLIGPTFVRAWQAHFAIAGGDR